MSVTIRVLLLLMSMMAYANVEVAGLSDRGWRFLVTLDGEYNNYGRLQEGIRHDRIHNTATPVDVPVLRPNPAMLFEVDDGEHVVFRHLLSVVDNNEDFFSVILLSFTGSDVAGPGQFDTSILFNLTSDDIKSDPTCVAKFIDFGQAHFFGSWPVCTRTINGTHPSWTVLYTCDSMIVNVPMSIGETKDLVPYEIKRIAPKFQLIDPPPGFINPCDKKESNPCDKK